MFPRKAPSDDILISLWEAGLTDQEVADQTGIKRRTAAEHRRRLGIEPVKSTQNLRKYDQDMIADMHRAGYTAAQIAREVGCNIRTVQRVRKRLGIGKAKPDMPPLEDRLRDAEAMLDDGAPFEAIMTELHIHRSTLEKYFPGRAWTNAQASEWAVAHRNANRLYRKLGV